MLSCCILWPGPPTTNKKSKRHEIKSDPTPLGYEGKVWDVCMLQLNSTHPSDTCADDVCLHVFECFLLSKPVYFCMTCCSSVLAAFLLCVSCELVVSCLWQLLIKYMLAVFEQCIFCVAAVG